MSSQLDLTLTDVNKVPSLPSHEYIKPVNELTLVTQNATEEISQVIFCSLMQGFKKKNVMLILNTMLAMFRFFYMANLSTNSCKPITSVKSCNHFDVFKM